MINAAYSRRQLTNMKTANFVVKSLFALGALFAFAAPTLAQTPAPAPAPPAKHVAKLPKWLADVTLTAEQTEKVHAIQKTNAAQAKVVRGDATLTEDQKKAKLADIKKDTRMQIMALLTPEQKAKVKAEHKGKKGGEPAAPAPASAPKG